MISWLVGLLANAADQAAVKELVRMQNKCGETALHQAVRAAANKVACIDHLMDVDPELSCLPFPHQEEEEDAGPSPLYLAISLGELEIARHLYVKSNGKLSYSGPDGRNALHAAVHRGQAAALPMILEWLIKDMKPKEGSSSVCLVSRLTSQRDRKQKGSTPLHLAASLNGWPGAGFLSRRFPKVWPTAESVATLLLDANESTVYQADDQGWYPIHVAAAFDSLGVVKVLLDDMESRRRRQDCATLRDGKGRTFLHVAAEMKNHSGAAAVVQYVCGEMPQQLSSMILNAQDSNGDTALHGAVRAGNLAASTSLLRNRLVRLDVANKDGMTPLDLSWTTLPSGFRYAFNPRNVVHLSLLYSGAPHGGGRPDLSYEKHSSERDVVEESKKYTEATQVTSIVTALIATVAFASAFTLPGGYRADGAAAAGTALLAGKSYAFDAFILADTLAFIFSMAATCSLVYAGLPVMDISIRNWYFNVSAFLLQSAARSLVAAFGLALYVVLAPVDHKTAVAVCAIVFATSLYGNTGAQQVNHVAYTARTRIGMRRVVVYKELPCID
ncbi:protein ACCELERATED CELL DEATH 6-like [Miscanthus floridulus]|uniref:protein ACCELERATED CELL DEATH 6-like n=1 Tax=Miscanthus floridulus TaxID=154761 RepID=UPI00345AD178